MKIINKSKEFLRKIYSAFYLKHTLQNKLNNHKNKSKTVASENDQNHFHSPYESPENTSVYEKEEFLKIPDTSIKPIAFYLPQYYPFEENNKFWGKGFTEWHNVSRALPLFRGQYQPRLAGELGYYDLRLKEVMHRQIELAKQHGIYGFCFHQYYLEDKPVMNMPINLFLKNKNLNMPFCLHWANEPWTVRWDGDKEKGGILLKQTHSDSENMGFIKNILPALKDKRYIKIDDKPILLIYRPELFPDFPKTADKWNTFCQNQGLKGLHLIMVQTFFDKTKDPGKYQCDAAVEFPPHQGFCVSKKLDVPFAIDNFEGEIIDYKKLAAFSMQKKKPSYPLFRGIMPGWDNTARTKTAKIYYGSSPAVYQEWLTKLGKYTKDNLPADRQFLFINAWNEWAEGAYLEPDRKFGYAYLNATARAIAETETTLSYHKID